MRSYSSCLSTNNCVNYFLSLIEIRTQYYIVNVRFSIFHHLCFVLFLGNKIKNGVSYIAHKNNWLGFVGYKLSNRGYIYNWLILPDYFILFCCRRWLNFPKVYLHKCFIAPIISTARLVLPKYYHKEDARCAAYFNNIWVNLKGKY